MHNVALIHNLTHCSLEVCMHHPVIPVPGPCGASATLALQSLHVQEAPCAPRNPPCDLAGRWVPKQERSRSLALVYSGMYTGSILGLALSPHMVGCSWSQGLCFLGVADAWLK